MREGSALGIPDEWYVARYGTEVTEQFLTGPPGTGPQPDDTGVTTFAANRKAAMVIYGHDDEANRAIFDWLRAIGLEPGEWSQLVAASGEASPYIGRVLEQAFRDAQAVVAFFTPDEHVIGRQGDVSNSDDWRVQARPNVLVEAGMALVTHPDRTVIVVLGNQELPSDLAGRHYVRIRRDEPTPLLDLANRLKSAGCDTNITGTDWLRQGRFPDRQNIGRMPRPLTS
jgi:predicted nucleotide-binding protein